jgi:hypothetical protein
LHIANPGLHEQLKADDAMEVNCPDIAKQLGLARGQHDTRARAKAAVAATTNKPASLRAQRSNLASLAHADTAQ